MPSERSCHLSPTVHRGRHAQPCRRAADAELLRFRYTFATPLDSAGSAGVVSRRLGLTLSALWQRGASQRRRAGTRLQGTTRPTIGDCSYLRSTWWKPPCPEAERKQEAPDGVARLPREARTGGLKARRRAHVARPNNDRGLHHADDLARRQPPRSIEARPRRKGVARRDSTSPAGGPGSCSTRSLGSCRASTRRGWCTSTRRQGASAPAP
jgi:hypothetical protein